MHKILKCPESLENVIKILIVFVLFALIINVSTVGGIHDSIELIMHTIHFEILANYL